MNHSSRSHHRRTTKLLTGAGQHQHRVDSQTGWGSQKFVSTTGCYRIGKIKADNQTRTATEGRYPTTLRNSLIKIRADVRSILSQALFSL